MADSPEIRISVRSPAEPLTKAADRDRANNGQDSWAQCDAYRILRDQIARYARGEILGQSILVAGHRGSGKTTLAHLAIQHIRWMVAPKKVAGPEDCRKGEDPNHYLAIPFLVPVNGPDLFLGHDDKRAGGKHLAEAAMVQIRRALHRALSEEIGKRFMDVCEQSPELQELSYQFRVDLDSSPPLALLRSYWQRAGLLESGLLGKLCGGRAGSGQAFKEILALHTAIQALRSSEPARGESGQGQENEGRVQARLAVGQSPTRSKSGIKTGIGDLASGSMQPDRVEETVRIAAPILSLLAGGYAANAVATALGPILGGAIGIATVALAYSFLSRTLLPKHDPTLTGDASAGAQDLLLPLLVDRIFDAGFAPVFVVDELDKIEPEQEESLDDLLAKLMNRLKYVVTDRAFFCFLADRAYYERFRQLQHVASHPIEETYFADKLLIYHRPSELREFLKSTYQRSDDSRTERCRQLLCSLGLSQSMSHVGNLASVIKKDVENGKVLLERPPELWKVPGYRMQILVQTAIDAVFSDSQVRERLRQEPEFTQWLSDALYHIPGQWRQEAPRLRFRIDQRPPSQIPPTLMRLLPSIALGERGAGTQSLEYRDVKFLFEQMATLARYLAVPARLALRILDQESESVSDEDLAVVIQSLPLLERDRDGEIELGEGDSRCYKWLFDQSGQLWRADEVALPFGVDDWQKCVEEDSENLTKTRFSLLMDLDQFLRTDLRCKSGFAELISAFQIFTRLPERELWKGLDEKLLENWSSRVSELNCGFEDFVPKLKDRTSRETIRKLLQFERAIYSAWRSYVVPVLAVAKHDGKGLAEAAQGWAVNQGDDWLAEHVGQNPADIQTFKKRLSSVSALGELRKIQPTVTPSQRTS